MKPRLLISAGLMALVASSAHAETIPAEPALLDVIVVSGSKRKVETELTVSPESAPRLGADVTYLAARTPGGARVANGELSGQVQYRGLFGERLNLRVDGQRFASGGPNLMDPSFHYAPTPIIASLVIDRGVSPVSKGPGLAGGADAVFKRIDFSDGETARLGYDVVVSGASVDNSISGGGVAGFATDSWRFNVLGVYEEGDDTAFDGGVIGGSSYKRAVYGGSTGVKIFDGELSLDLRHQKTGASGNPAFPMDIRFFRSDFARLAYEGDLGGVTLKAALNYVDVDHAMNNFDMRPAPVAANLRETLADSATRGGEMSLGFGAVGGRLTVGGDIEEIRHDQNIVNPANADFFVKPFPDIEQHRYGTFAEWRGATGPMNGEIGVRVDRHEFEAGAAKFGAALPMGPVMLANAFNAANRSGDETTVDAALRLWTRARGGFSWRATLARKTQLPGYIQRFGWLPLNASGGLADGNIYVGDFSLKPESALIAEIGFDYSGRTAYARPTIYLRRIDNYIQGVPFDATPGVADSPAEMISTMSGDSTPLRWANVDARLYGFDMDAGINIAGPLRAEGVFTYVRGERRDIDDNLYRIAAPNATIGLAWDATRWSAVFEARGALDQNKVSVTNGESPSDGYVVFNLYGDFEISDGVRLSAGVQNLTDKIYRDHLSGLNRNGFGDVAIGERIPGAGRSVFVRLSLAN